MAKINHSDLEFNGEVNGMDRPDLARTLTCNKFILLLRGGMTQSIVALEFHGRGLFTCRGSSETQRCAQKLFSKFAVHPLSTRIFPLIKFLVNLLVTRIYSAAKQQTSLTESILLDLRTCPTFTKKLFIKSLQLLENNLSRPQMRAP